MMMIIHSQPMCATTTTTTTTLFVVQTGFGLGTIRFSVVEQTGEPLQRKRERAHPQGGLQQSLQSAEVLNPVQTDCCWRRS